MKFLGVSIVAMATLLSVAPVSLRSIPGSGIPFSIGVASAEAAELNLPSRQRVGFRSRYYARYSRLYDPYCGGPYVGGGFNGGTYYGGPWIDLRCYGNVY